MKETLELITGLETAIKMDTIRNYIDYNTLMLFIGGLLSLFLAIVILIAKQEHKRNLERQRLKALQEKQPEAIGDIEAKLNDSYEYQRLNFGELMTSWGLQPLFIIVFIDLFDKRSTMEVLIAFGLTLHVILHEFWFSYQYSKNKVYQFALLAVWAVIFLFINYKAIEVHSEKVKQEQTKTKPAT